MEDVATGRGKQALNGTGAMLPHNEGHGSFKGSFDLDDGSLISRPRTLIAIMAGLFVVGGICAVVLYRITNIETTLADLPNVIENKIAAATDSAEQQRKIDCLQQQIANKSWVCPYAIQIAKEPEPLKRRAPVTVAKQPTSSGFFDFTGPALAKGSK